MPLLSLAVASWGASLLTEYLVNPRHIERLLYGEFMGATQPAGILLEYLAWVLGSAAVLQWGARLTRPWRERHRTISIATRVFVRLIVALLLLEGAVRGFNVWNIRTQEAPTKPSSMWNTRYGHRNSLGYRDREFDPRARRAAYRILLLGDSFTFGWGIRNPADRFGDHLEKQLNATAGGADRVSVFNAGVLATNSVEHLMTARALVPRLRPNLALLIYVFNDIDHLGKPPAHPALAPPSFAARFSLHRLLMLNSHFADQALLLWRAWTWSGPSTDAYFSRMYADAGLLDRHLDVLAEIQRTSEEAGAVFRVVPFELFPDEQHRERYTRFVRACEARGLPVWSMRDVFDGRSYRTLTVNRRDHHPNELANLLVADYLTARVAELMAAGGGSLGESTFNAGGGGYARR